MRNLGWLGDLKYTIKEVKSDLEYKLTNVAEELGDAIKEKAQDLGDALGDVVEDSFEVFERRGDEKVADICNKIDKIEEADSIIENKKYVIYTRKDRKIIRYDKETGETKKLFQLDKKQDIEDMVTALEIYQNKLYYLNANRLYESNIDGSDRKLVADADKLKGFEDEIKWIGNFQHYKNKIYLVIGGSDIYELEENNKIKRIVEGAVQSCFYKGSLYYKNSYDPAIYKMDLKTKKSKLVRGQEAPEDDDQYDKIMKYNDFYMIDGNFYYGAIVNNVPEKTGLYKYNTNGKDQLEIKDKKGYAAYSAQKGVYINKETDKDDDLTLMLYANNKKKQLLEKFDAQNDMTIIDGYLLYLEDEREDKVYSMIKLP